MQKLLLKTNPVPVGRNPEKLASARSRLSEYKTAIHLIEADLADISQVEEAVNQIPAVFPQIDTLVNNAGQGRSMPYRKSAAVRISERQLFFWLPIKENGLLGRFSQWMADGQLTDDFFAKGKSVK